PPRSEADSMQTYAVYWNDPEGERCAGRVSLGPSFAELDGGTSDGRLRSLRIGFDEIASVRYQHGRLHVWRRTGAPVRLGSAASPPPPSGRGHVLPQSVLLNAAAMLVHARIRASKGVTLCCNRSGLQAQE